MSSTRRQRSEYLKNGCKECKRRKIKCDEFRSPPAGTVRVVNAQGRNLCWQCIRLKKECEYPMKGEKVARVLMKVLMEKERAAQRAAAFSASPSSEMNPSLHVKMTGNTIARGNTGGNASIPGSSNVVVNTSMAGNANIVGNMHINGISEMAPGIPSVPNIPSIPNLGASNVSNVNMGNAGINSTVPYMGNNIGMANVPGSIPSVSSGMSLNTLPRYDKLRPVQPYSYGYPSPASYTTPDVGTQYYDLADLVVLAADLNNLVADMMSSANMDKNRVNGTNAMPPTPSDEATSDQISTDQSKALGKVQKLQEPVLSKVSNPDANNIKIAKVLVSLNDWIPRNVSLGYIDVRTADERLFLQEFHHEFANFILPFGPFDRNLQTYYNPVRDILLKCASREPFLLAAILGQGAHALFGKTGAPEHEKAYCYHLLRCLELLGPALGHANDRSATTVSCNIEAVLLTVLLLTSSNAANAKQNWRPHLNGAKDLLLKHTTSRLRNSKVLIFCKYWFILFEILAGLGLRRGGTVHLDTELDMLLSLHDPYELLVLTELGLILPNGFNMICGFHNELIHPLRDLIKLLSKARLSSYIPTDTYEYIRLLSEFHHHLNVHFVNKGAVAALEEYPGQIIPNGLLLESITLDDKPYVLSWMDLSQLLYALAASITILTDFLQLPFDSPQVQTITMKITELLAVIPVENLSFPYSVLMIQWPLLVAGLNSVKDSDKSTVTRVFSTATKVGAGSAGHSMNSLRRVWRKHEGNAEDSSEESMVDVVNY